MATPRLVLEVFGERIREHVSARDVDDQDFSVARLVQYESAALQPRGEFNCLVAFTDVDARQRVKVVESCRRVVATLAGCCCLRLASLRCCDCQRGCLVTPPQPCAMSPALGLYLNPRGRPVTHGNVYRACSYE